jgi:L-ascorbate metabolism protein UlaG (beta-lactamase superfamily)
MNELSGIDILLIPSGGTYTMDNEDAVKATIAIGPKVAIPMHIWDTNPNEFKRKVEASSTIKVAILSPGDTYEV